MPRELYIGIMSGTSLDGIDAALCEFLGDPAREVSIVAEASISWPEELRRLLYSLATEERVSLDTLTRVQFSLATYYSNVVRAVLENAAAVPADITAIGLHGQTVRHLPKAAELWPGGPLASGTLQLGSGAALAAITGIDVVSDFRSADVALGGQGAPLVPMFDNTFLRSASIDRAALNIGGIANITWLPKDDARSVVAYDTGPGNMIIDALAREFFDEPFDTSGEHARRGIVDQQILDALLSHNYFKEPPPKSTGRELFGHEFVRRFITDVRSNTLSHDDAIATATELTARSIADCIQSLTERPLEILVSGGGAKNDFLLERLHHLIPFASVKSTETVGIPAQSKEAIAFAYFAFAFVNKRHIHLPQTTGASRSIILGSISRGQ